VNGRPYTVVGVTPERFHGTTILTCDVWLPLNMVGELTPRRTASILSSRQSVWLVMGGRLKPGVTVERARAEVATIGEALEREYPVENRGKGIRVVASSPIPGNGAPVAAFLAVLMAIVSLVLAVACANVAGVLLARATARRREIAVRLAIGAGRGRLVRQMLVESMLLFVCGGLVGIALARAMTTALVALLPSIPVPIDLTLALDGRVLAFTIGLSFVASILCGIAPALHASRSAVVAGLKSDERGGPERQRLRHAFVVGQVALSVVLVVGAGLFVRALQRAANINPGFDPNGLELAALDLSIAGYTETTGVVFADALITRVRQVPGVESATLSAMVPLGNGGLGLGNLRVPGSDVATGRGTFRVDWNVVTPGYFRTMRMPLVAGRDFTDTDRAGAPSVVIVNETAARWFWGTVDVIGKTLLQNDGVTSRTLNVVAIARDAKYRNLGEEPRGFVYVPLAQQYVPRTTIIARATQGQRLAAELRSLVGTMNPSLPIVSAQTFEDYAALGLVPQRVAAAVSGSLGLVGLLLAAIGIYGVTAYLVTSRTREIGIRMALGAQRRDAVRMVLQQGMTLALAGIAIGLLCAAGASRLLGSLLFGVGGADPLAFGVAAVVFCLVGLAACYVPARRATDIDPMDALRYE
jgi:predicted permease